MTPFSMVGSNSNAQASGTADFIPSDLDVPRNPSLTLGVRGKLRRPRPELTGSPKRDIFPPSAIRGSRWAPIARHAGAAANVR